MTFLRPYLLVAMALSPVVFASSAAGAENAPGAGPLGSRVFQWSDLAVKPTAIGERREVADRRTATLEAFECHVTTLNAGQAAHAPHRHAREELVVLKEGTLDVFINGRTQRVGPGSVGFFASNDLHAMRNAGDGLATYFVFNFTTAATHTAPAPSAAGSAAPGRLPSGVFDWQKLAVKPTQTGARRDLFDAPTVTLGNFEGHVTTLNPGEVPHAPHHHPDEEILLVKEGAPEVTINGVAHPAGSGSICFFGSNDEHGLKNTGATPATYYVIRFVTEKLPPRAAN